MKQPVIHPSWLFMNDPSSYLKSFVACASLWVRRFLAAVDFCDLRSFGVGLQPFLGVTQRVVKFWKLLCPGWLVGSMAKSLLSYALCGCARPVPV